MRARSFRSNNQDAHGPGCNARFRSASGGAPEFDNDDFIDYSAIKIEDGMVSITIRNLDPSLEERLRICAAEHGHSMEAEVRRILDAALREPERPRGPKLYERIHSPICRIG